MIHSEGYSGSRVKEGASWKSTSGTAFYRAPDCQGRVDRSIDVHAIGSVVVSSASDRILNISLRIVKLELYLGRHPFITSDVYWTDDFGINKLGVNFMIIGAGETRCLFSQPGTSWITLQPKPENTE